LNKHRLAIMQPYFFPYIGYFQLLAAVDEFVLLDDVNYIKKGWINRNTICVQGKPYLFTIPLLKASQNKKISEIARSADPKPVLDLIRTIEFSYRNAPYFEQNRGWVNAALLNASSNLADYIANSIGAVCNYLGIETPVLRATDLGITRDLGGQARILSISKTRNAETYINPSGGIDLYDPNLFKDANIELKFLKSRPLKPAMGNDSTFSILHLIFTMPPEVVKLQLREFDLYER
ncbi:MAG: hypothetical protein EOP04_29490, partial [Proteobacteria bacterium]